MDNAETREASKELYPPIKGREWHGDLDDRAAARFYANIGVPDPITGCVEWLGGHDGHGYSAFVLDGRVLRAHQVAMIDAGIHPPEDEARYEVHHACENRGCINPHHCEWVTPGEHKDIHRQMKLNRQNP